MQQLGFFGVGCNLLSRNDENKLKIDIKCMINKEVLVKRLDKQSNLIHFVKLDQQMFDVKIEYSLFVNRKYLQLIPLLTTEYNQSDNSSSVIVLCSQGVKIPKDSDFLYFFDCFDLFLEGKNVMKQQIEKKPIKTIYRLLICAMILQYERLTDYLINYICEELNMYKLMMLALLTKQYEAEEFSKYFYKLLIQYFQYEGQVHQQHITNPHLQQILLHITDSQIQLIEDDVVVVTDGPKQLRVCTAFFKSLYRFSENKKKKYFQPLQKYQYYKNSRKKTSNQMDDTYPHYFKLQDEAEGKTILFAFQQSAHSEILIFEKEQVQYLRYSDDYIACVERNFWGTVFQVYDYGYPKEAARVFPKYFGEERKEIVNIQYQTNIMASVPRKFSATMLNYVNNQEMTLHQLEPVYNEDKECYQLNFYGRAKRASARNFEMIDPQDQNIIYLLHGKWEKNLFNLDYRYPMNLAQAFSFSLVSVSKKFLVQ